MFNFNTKAETVFKELISLGKLPREGNFLIDEYLIADYKRVYLKQNGLELDLDPWALRKYAGSSLLSLKRHRGIPLRPKRSEGYLYFIGNPAWANDLKVGISSDYEKRLATYQTYSPNRDYFIHGWEFVSCKKTAEDLILNKFQVDTDKGEWVSYSQHSELIKYLRSMVPIVTLVPSERRFQVNDLVRFRNSKGQKFVGLITGFAKESRYKILCKQIFGGNNKSVERIVEEQYIMHFNMLSHLSTNKTVRTQWLS